MYIQGEAFNRFNKQICVKGEIMYAENVYDDNDTDELLYNPDDPNQEFDNDNLPNVEVIFHSDTEEYDGNENNSFNGMEIVKLD